MLKAKQLNKIAKLYGNDNNSALNKIEKIVIEAAINGEYDVEIDNNLLDLDIRKKLANKGFTLYHGNITTGVSWRNI